MARFFDDAASECLNIDQAVTTSNTVTLACWMYTDDDTNASAMLGLFDKDVHDRNRFALLFNVPSFGGKYAGMWACDFATVIKQSWDATTLISANTWYHVAGTLDEAAGGVIGYTNGTAGAADAGAHIISNLDRTSIARLGDSTPSFYWSGGIAEAGVWDVVLTPAEIAVLATGIRPIMVRPQNIVAYWPLVRDQDYDIVGGYDMTPINGPTIAAHVPVIYGATLGRLGEAGAGPGPTNLYPGLSGLSGLTGLTPIMGVA